MGFRRHILHGWTVDVSIDDLIHKLHHLQHTVNHKENNGQRERQETVLFIEPAREGEEEFQPKLKEPVSENAPCRTLGLGQWFPANGVAHRLPAGKD